MRIAIIGAGIQGISAALEFNRRGYPVDVYEREPAALTRASVSNEGKLHLGFVYGNDPSYRTVQTVLKGSLSFCSIVSRWMPFPNAAVAVSSPFAYVVHRESLKTVAETEAHLGRVAALIDEAKGATGAGYVGPLDGPSFAPMAKGEADAMFDGATVTGAYTTVERSIDPRAFGREFRAAAESAKLVTLLTGVEVESASPLDDGRIALEVRQDGSGRREVYDRVINAAWEGLLALDATFGLVPKRAWLHRFKYGMWIDLKKPLDIPSTTVVLGPFGDISAFGRKRLYLSWYPACMIGSSSALAPPDFAAMTSEQSRAEIIDESLAGLGRLVPGLAAVKGLAEKIELRGGIIFAWGRSDIDDAGSELHRRYEIGITSVGNYHSVNTGRYCVAPTFALEVCDRVLGAR